MTDQQLPPHSIEAERSVIGSLFIDPDAYFEIADILTYRDFYRAYHGQVYKAIGDLLANERAVDMVTVAEVVASRDKDTNEATADFIGYVNAVPTSVNVREYALIVRSTAQRRRLIKAAGNIAKGAFDESRAIDKVMGEAEQSLYSVTDDLAVDGLSPISEVARDLIDHTEALYERGGEVTGVQTGFVDLDRVLEGFEGSDLVVMAARPGMGKTSLALALARYATSSGKRGAFFSLEMPKRQVAQRLVAAAAKIQLPDLRHGRLNGNFDLFIKEAGELSKLPLHIDDTPSLSTTQLAAKCRRLAARDGLDFVVVDYIGLMRSSRDRDNRVQEVTDISRELKSLALALDVPVLALSQLNRACESRQDKRPQLADLRDSGALEQDADIVLFIYRDAYYYPDTTDRPNIAEVDIAKHRNGPTGIVDLYWHEQYATFRNLQRQEINL